MHPPCCSRIWPVANCVQVDGLVGAGVADCSPGAWTFLCMHLHEICQHAKYQQFNPECCREVEMVVLLIQKSK
jgi:hypothetical protein